MKKIKYSTYTHHIIFGLTIMGFLAACKTTGPGRITHDLQISRHHSVALSDARADQILNSMGTILQINDGSGDVACDVAFTRNGAISVFNIGNGMINSASDFTAVNSQPGNVKVVKQINWCGGLSPNIIGCAPVPGTSMVVVRFTTNQEGLLWVHEFGHNKGLSHNNQQRAVMQPTINVNNKHVNQSECDSYRVQPAVAAASSHLSPASSESQSAMQDIMDIKQFVRQTYIHGLPYEEASKFAVDLSPSLISMLTDPAEEQHWANIAVTLCIIGDPVGVDAVINFIDNPEGDTLSQANYRAKTSAIMALGYAVHKTGNEPALDYLIQNSRNTEVWSQKELNWISPFQTDTNERNLDLSTMAVMGLALAGTPEAGEALQALQDPTVTGIDAAFQRQVSSVVSEAIKTNQEISEIGLIEYYRRNQ